MSVVRIVKVAADEVVDVIAVRDGGMAALRSVDVSRFMGRAFVIGRADGRIPFTHFKDMLVDVVAVRMMDVPVVQVVHVVRVFDRGVPAAFAMDVRMTAVDAVRIVSHWVLHAVVLASFRIAQILAAR